MLFRKALPPSWFVALTICSILLLTPDIFPDGTARAQGTRRAPESTPARTYQIRGTVRSAANDLAMEMIKVDLKMFTGETVNSYITRSNGDFEFSGLRNGDYYIEINHQGYEPLRERIEIISASRTGVFLFLQPIESPSERPGPPISARELALPRKALDAYEKGMEQLAVKNSPEASLRHFEKAIASLDTYYEAYHMRGVAYLQMGKLQEAEREFQLAFAKSGNTYADPCFGLAAILLMHKKFAEAEQKALQGLALNEKAWRGHFELARAQLGQNHLDDALKSIRQARVLKPDFPDIYLVSANISIRRQDANALAEDFEGFLKVQPTGPVADDVRKRLNLIRTRMAQAKAATPTPEKKPQ